MQTLTLRVVERGEDDLLHTVALGKALRALTSLTSLSLDNTWDPGEWGDGCGGPQEYFAEAIVRMTELRSARSPSYSHSFHNSVKGLSRACEKALSQGNQ